MIRSLFLLAAVLLTAATAQADTAIVVGVNEYPKLPSGSNLRGCVPDAEKMAATLKKYGFDVKVITNGEATHDGILNALRNCGNRADERFVFYFAGHGTNAPGGDAALLPSDAAIGSSEFDLRAEELKTVVMGVPATSRTIILDSCFSGGMVRTKSVRLGMKTRYFRRPNSNGQPISVNRLSQRGDGAKDFVRNSAAGPVVSPITAGIPCYLVATGPNEQAAEDLFEGEPHGVFTKFLTDRLEGATEKWEAVVTDVSGKAADYLDDTQHPEISPQFRNQTVFARGEAPQPTPGPKPLPTSLWDLYNTDRPDAASVQVLLTPDIATNRVGDKLTLTAQVGRAGYLIVIERGTSGSVNLLFPEKPQIAATKTDGGRITLGVFRPDQEGDERVKAILFEKQEDAAALLAAFGQGTRTRSIPRKEMHAVPILKSRDLQRVSEEPAPTPSGGFGFFTSDIQFEVVR